MFPNPRVMVYVNIVNRKEHPFGLNGWHLSQSGGFIEHPLIPSRDFDIAAANVEIDEIIKKYCGSDKFAEITLYVRPFSATEPNF